MKTALKLSAILLFFISIEPSSVPLYIGWRGALNY